MRPFRSTIPFHDALRIVIDAAIPIARVETLRLEDADGRVAAQDVVAAVDVPPFDRAAMDGYAVVAADTMGADAAKPIPLVCIARVQTGQVPTRSVERGECMEISTGAPVPAGADAVVMVEETTRDGDRVRFAAPARSGQNIGRRAADIARGQRVIAAGDVLNPSRLGAIAATGTGTISVFARPRIALLSTGDEVTTPGEALEPGRIYNVNRYTIAAVVARHGGEVIVSRTVGDTIEALEAAFGDATAADVVISSGGSSVGDHDLLQDVVSKLGEILFHGIAIKPGKPTLFGRANGVPVFALSGYPTSCLCNAYTLVVPFLRKMARLPPWEPRRVELPLARPIVSTAGRRQFYTVRINNGTIEPAFKASGDITSMANADGYIEIPEDTLTMDAGDIATVTLF